MTGSTLAARPAGTSTATRPTSAIDAQASANTWTRNPEAEAGHGYSIQIYDASSWARVETGSSATGTYTVQAELAAGTTCAWYVDGFDANYQPVGFTPASFQFTVASPPSGLLVTNTNDSGPGSLRQAILDANATPGTDTIRFGIPGTGPSLSRGR